MSEPTCAVWYWSHSSVYYVLCRDETEAAKAAHGISDDDMGAPAGVQRADGTYTPTETWTEYQAESNRRIQRAYDAVREEVARPKPVRHTVKPPFDYDGDVVVDADAPSWLGRSGRRSQPQEDG